LKNIGRRCAVAVAVKVHILVFTLACLTVCGCSAAPVKWDSKDPDAKRLHLMNLGDELTGDEFTPDEDDWDAGEALLNLALVDESALVRATAVRMYVQVWKDGAVPVVVPLLGDKAEIVRHSVVQTLGDFDAKSAVEPLCARLGKEKSAGVCKEIIRVLSVLCPDGAAAGPVIGALINALDDEDKAVRFFAEEALGTLTHGPFGHNRNKWKAWWKENKDKATVKKKPAGTTGSE
jgi:hypothetical protein